MRIIGITGISGAGKTTSAKVICELEEAEHINADRFVRKGQIKGEEYYNKIVETFGKEILEDNGEIDRSKLAKLIFSNKNAKQKIDNLTLTYIVPQIKEAVRILSKSNISVVIDAPLLFEMELDKICDFTIGIIADEEICIKRISQRDLIDEKDAKARIQSQKSCEYFKINCDYVINNETNEEYIYDMAKEIFNGDNLSNTNVIHVKTAGIEYLQFRKLLEYSDKIGHCYTLRPLDFNIGDKTRVIKEYEKICNVFGIDSKKVYRPKQTHSNNVKRIDTNLAGIYEKDFEDIDGLITNRENKILSLTYADCIPLYFYDTNKNIIRKYTFWVEGNISRDCKNSCKKNERRV